MQILKQSAELLHITPNAAKLMEEAGRTCYQTSWAVKPDSAVGFVKMIFGRGHHTILEHATATFRVICDRGVSHEFVRHRLMVYSQESTRFCNYAGDRFGNEIKVIEPPGLTPDMRVCWEAGMRDAEARYIQLRLCDCPPEIARSVLPQSLKTEFVVTANLREWCLFLRQRYYGLTGTPHPQMKEIATHIRQALMMQAPEVFELLDREAKKVDLIDKLLNRVQLLRNKFRLDVPARDKAFPNGLPSDMDLIDGVLDTYGAYERETV